MFTEKEMVIEKLTGVRASKKSYYTDLKATIAELEKKNRKLEILSEVAKGFQVTGTMETSLQHILETIYELYPIDRVSLSLIEQGAMSLKSVYPLYAEDSAVGMHLPRKESLYWKAIEQNMIVLHEWDPADTYTFVEERTLSALNLHYVCVIPLRIKASTIGVLTFAAAERIECDQSDISFFRQLSDHIAVMMENARLYQEVYQGRKEWEETFQAVADLLILTDNDHRIVRCNQASYSFFDVSPEAVAGQRCHDLLFHDTEEFCPIEESYNGESMKNYQMTLKNGRVCDIQTYPVRDGDGVMKGLLIYIKDVTARIKTEAQLQHSGKLAAIGEMAAGVAHELNSPLTAVIGNTQILQRSLKEEGPPRELAVAIERGGRRCQTIVQNLLSFSRPEKEESIECDMNVAVEDVLSLIGFQIEKENIVIEKHYSSSLPLVKASSHQVGQVIINLLLNAKDALKNSEKKDKKIKIKTRVVYSNVVLEVKDNGCGIGQRQKASVFEPFFTTKRKQNGTGLGLSVSKDIAEKNAGRLTFTSEEERGSTFQLKLPVYGGEEKYEDISR
ncbi:GAF domain-containing sensor histidine kinase [Marinococcus halotolerans]|uniref:GAF domain-containing sensor histidine kinase n=1 Tax=Marinococcus halotolerans TaxID=301092 RepID=UPI0003B2F342|nr:GAF domain-containing sensor histidine kinase [Marinococcus halotolerans]